MVKLVFNIEADVDLGQVVVLTGNCKELGNWLCNGVKPLQKSKDTKWKLEIDINCVAIGSAIEYRYAVCSFLTGADGQVNTIIHKWETHKQPRNILLSGPSVVSNDGCFGVKDGIKCVRDGWLTDQSEVRFMLHSNPLEFTNIKEPSNVGFRVTANHIRQTTNNSLPIQVKAFNEDEYFAKTQSKSGKIYRNNEFVVFSSQVLDVKNTVFKIEVLSSEDHEHVHICGHATVFGTNLTKTRDCVPCPVTNSNGDAIGILRVQYVVIKPLPNCSSLCTFEKPYQWSSTGCLSIGHRGMGRSFKDTGLLVEIGIAKSAEKYIENTIGAFKGATEAGAHMVEFDVHICKDRIPIVYHDYDVPVRLQKADDPDKHFEHKILLSDLTCDQLQQVQTTHTPVNADLKNDDRLFPPLAKVLNETPIHLAFNVEIKYPMEQVNGISECPDYATDMSDLVDNTLQVLIEHAQNRKIVISSFDTDVCALLRLKQNRFPVMLIHCGPTEKYIAYSDPRITTVQSAMYWIKGEQLAGMVGHVDDYRNDDSVIPLLSKSNIHLFLWGEDNKNPVIVQDMMSKGVEGILTDDVTTLPQLT
ncbi:glycerophosphocholine phosphodiesterase GPCPD1-like [Antedon mediterranea]|uniref:glycerophosphocholine phosphodiesterase GPCPD1-like n=1 Tax=Antedon mediterranea TaxID=105859 RepID=UPI003AF41067